MKKAHAGHRPQPETENRDVQQSVTTNSRDVGAGGGSSPLGESDQDSRSWPTGEEAETQKGGDRSDRAAISGATGERSTSGGRNKPQPKNQDEKGMGHPRNR